MITADVDAVHARALVALEAGAGIVEAPRETAFGSGVATRAFTLRDTEGNLWTFGTYRGAARSDPVCTVRPHLRALAAA